MRERCAVNGLFGHTSRLGRTNSENEVGFLACVNNLPIGYIVANIYATDKANIVQVEVDNDHRQRGIGSKLIELVLELAVDAKCKEIGLEVANANSNAGSLYSKLGFEGSFQMENNIEKYKRCNKCNLPYAWKTCKAVSCTKRLAKDVP